MGDRLDDLPEGDTPSNPAVMDAYFEKPKETKRSWKEYGKILFLAGLSFALAANPVTGLTLTNINLFQGPYKNFLGQGLLFLIVFAVLMWYF